MKKILLTAALAATAIGGTALAAQTTPPAGKHHRHRGNHLMKLDANKDGTITRDEAMTAAGERFDKMDANHDGRIDQTEMAALRTKMRAHMQERRAQMQARRAQAQTDTDQ